MKVTRESTMQRCAGPGGRKINAMRRRDISTPVLSYLLISKCTLTSFSGQNCGCHPQSQLNDSRKPEYDEYSASSFCQRIQPFRELTSMSENVTQDVAHRATMKTWVRSVVNTRKAISVTVFLPQLRDFRLQNGNQGHWTHPCPVWLTTNTGDRCDRYAPSTDS